MNSKVVLNTEIRRLIESRMKSTLKGIEKTFQQILRHQKIGLEDLKETVQSLEESFNLSQKWILQILFILFLRNTMGFGELKRILGINSNIVGQIERSPKTRLHKKSDTPRTPFESYIFSNDTWKEHGSASTAPTLLF